MFDRVSQGRELQLVEICDGDEGRGLGQGNEPKATQLVIFTDRVLFFEDLVIGGLHLGLSFLIDGGGRQGLAGWWTAEGKVRLVGEELSVTGGLGESVSLVAERKVHCSMKII